MLSQGVKFPYQIAKGPNKRCVAEKWFSMLAILNSAAGLSRETEEAPGGPENHAVSAARSANAAAGTVGM